MRPLGFWVVFVVAGTALASLSFSSSIDGTVPGSTFNSYEDVTTMNQGGVTTVIHNRKLKVRLLLERSQGMSTTRSKSALGGIDMEDYPRFDPTPSSKAAIKHGTIVHGAPLMPHIPRPTPPGHPRHGPP